jgi:hypothetical protein
MSAQSLNFMRRMLLIVLLLSLIGGGGYAIFRFYPYIFSKSVNGHILNVERVTSPESIIASGRDVPPEQLFSVAVSIKDSTGEIHTASSEDRQWAVAKVGQCAEAKFFPHPPWNLQKSGTYFGARLLRLYECPDIAPAGAVPATQ